MRKPVEIIQGDKSLRLNLYIIVASYLLIVILIEPAIDFLLLSLLEQKSPASIEQINQIKLIVSTLIYVLLGLIPAIFTSWFGYRVVASSKLPPVLLSGKTHFPFTVVVIKGRSAKMFGLLTIIISLVLIFQLFLHLIKILFL
ncbi:MAG: hypothetical protein KAT06_09200 [Gammaproteobacteria bacterium]|nr:hypothetical protein [Gammaproteobacteria bacterium]